MSKIVYVDTNIFMDFLEGRNEKAFGFFKEAVSCKYVLLISDLVLKELNYQKLEPSVFIKFLKNKLRVVNISQEHKTKAKGKYKVRNNYFSIEKNIFNLIHN